MSRRILLINTNTVKPPVSPVGLEYAGEALLNSGIAVDILDLSFTPDWRSSLRKQLQDNEPLLVGMTVRNTDDCSFVSRRSFLPWIASIVSELRYLTGSPVVLGGAGFSTMPVAALKAAAADMGVAGDGEEALPALARCLLNAEDFTRLPNLVHRQNGKVVSNPRIESDLGNLPAMRRELFDNRRYEEYGAMVGIETKRGCPGGCIYCADPIAKGKVVRTWPIKSIIQEIRSLIEQGVCWLHMCDSEFNIPLEHAKNVCTAIINQGLGQKINWYCYCSPVPFDRELALLMKAAGCSGINFGIDSLCDEQLQRLGRIHSSDDVSRLVNLLDAHKINYMCDLLIGGPGETHETIIKTIEKAKKINISLVGIAAGVRVYPHTYLRESIANGTIRGKMYPEICENPGQPLFYVSPSLDNDLIAEINRRIDGDERFLLLSSPSDGGSYNYADDEMLCALIQKGSRGAYWDILKKNQ